VSKILGGVAWLAENPFPCRASHTGREYFPCLALRVSIVSVLSTHFSYEWR
jgi:hypothetical protein